MATFLATVTLESCSDKNKEKNENRLVCALNIADQLASTIHGDCIILFPGGWFYNNSDPAADIIETTTSQIQDKISTYQNEIVLCFGIDGLMTQDRFDQDQLGLAVGRSGLLALGRKFHLSQGDMEGKVIPATNYLSLVQGYERTFILNGYKFFLAVCYDIKGFADLNLANPGIDVVLNMVHFFYSNQEGQGLSGVADFTRKILANASRQWDCPVFATATFVRREITEKYRTGMYWRMGTRRITDCLTDDNSLRPIDELGFRCKIAEGEADIRVYDLDAILGDINACRYELGKNSDHRQSVKTRIHARLPIRNPEAERALREAAERNSAGESYTILTEGLAHIFGEKRDEQKTKITYFGPNRIDFPGRVAIDMISLLPRTHQVPGAVKVRVYLFALAAHIGVKEAEIRAVLPQSFSESGMPDSVHPGNYYISGPLDAKSAAQFITALEGWAHSLPV